MFILNSLTLFTKKVKYILVLCLIPVYFVLEANNQYWGLVPVWSSIRIALIILASISTAFFVTKFFVNAEKSIMIIFWFSFHYLFFWVIYKAITSIHFFSFFSHYKFYLPFLFLISVAYVFYISKTKDSRLAKMTSYTTLLLMILVSLELYKSMQNRNSDTKTTVACTESVKLGPGTLTEKPDVFLIVMDEYAGFKTLMEQYKFSNIEFSGKLESNGFFVTKAPSSNYNGTLFSTLSLLNMAYLDTSTIGDLTSAKAYARTAKSIEGNTLFRFFQDNGYKTINNSFLRIDKTDGKPFLFLPVEDRLILDKTFGHILKGNLLLNLPFNGLQSIAGTTYAQYDSYNARVIKNMNRIVSDTTDKNLFVYTHLMMPHSPYLHTEDGKQRRFSDAYNEFKSKKYRESYLPYLKYCNQIVTAMIDSVQAHRKKSVIVLVSDHGNRFYGYDRNLERDFCNFIAVYSADKNYEGFTDTVSLVNVFRLVLNNQFKQKLTILPNYQINVTKGVLN